jgi:hypothetical protein
MPTISLAWGAATGDVAGYKVHMGLATGVINNPLSGWPQDVGNVLSADVVVPDFNTDYFFEVRAYNSFGAEGSPTNEVLGRVDNIPPSAPGTLTVTGTGA